MQFQKTLDNSFRLLALVSSVGYSTSLTLGGFKILIVPNMYVRICIGLYLERGVRGAKVKIFGGANMD